MSTIGYKLLNGDYNVDNGSSEFAKDLDSEFISAAGKYDKQEVTEVLNEYYSATGVVSTSASYKYADYAITDVNSEIYVSIYCGSSSGTQMAIYFDENGDYIVGSRQNIGTGSPVYYNREKLIIPSNAAKVGLTASNVAGYQKPIVVEKAVANAKQFTILSTKKYVSLGDSITEGFGSTTGYSSYSYLINNHVNFAFFTNLGKSSTTCMITSGRPALATYVAQVSDSDEKIITVMIGTNDYVVQNPVGDSAAVIAKTYASLTDTASYAESLRLHLETLILNNINSKIIFLTPINDNGGLTIPLSSYREVARDICEYLSIDVFEVHKTSGLTHARSDVFVDNLHPTDLGYSYLANDILNRLQTKFIEQV